MKLCTQDFKAMTLKKLFIQYFLIYNFQGINILIYHNIIVNLLKHFIKILNIMTKIKTFGKVHVKL